MASDDSAEHQFVQWAKQAAAPICTLDPTALDTSNLQLLQQAVGDARVVVLSEAFHNCKEFIYLHHRVIGSLLRRWASKEVRRCAGCKGDGSEALLCKLCPDRGPAIAVAVALVLGQLALALRSAKHTAADGAQPESTPKELQSSSKSLTEIRCQLPGVSHVGQENSDTVMPSLNDLHNRTVTQTCHLYWIGSDIISWRCGSSSWRCGSSSCSKGTAGECNWRSNQRCATNTMLATC